MSTRATPLPADLLASGLIWQADRLARSDRQGWSTGFPVLDAELPGGGWPRDAIIELISEQPGIGELQLIMPMLRLAPPARWVAWVAPPFMPYAPALAAGGLDLAGLLLIRPHDHAQSIWATRQALASGACHAVALWSGRIDTAALRRLQLTAEASATPLFLYRPGSAARSPSPAVLRLQLLARPDGLGVVILKRKGPITHKQLRLALPSRLRRSPAQDALDSLTPARAAPAGIHPRRH